MKTSLLTIVIMLTSAVLFYLLVLLSFEVFGIAVGKDPTQGGFLIFSPLAFLIIGMVIPAGFYGIICGGFVAVSFSYATRSTSHLIMTAGIIGTRFSACAGDLEFSFTGFELA